LIQPVYVASFLHQTGDVYAFGDMAFSIGALLAGILTTRLFSEKHAVRGIIVLNFVAAAMYGLMAANKILFLFFAANFIIGACNSAVRIQRVTYMFHHVPNKVIGRTGSVFFAINVFLRLCVVALFGLPFFHLGSNILYAVIILAAICVSASLVLIFKYKELMHQPEIRVGTTSH